MKTRRMRWSLPLLAASALLSAAPATAAARSDRFHHHASSAGAQAAVLDWYDITNSTISAAAFAEPVTGSDAWDVSWLAAARAVKQGHGETFQLAALAQAIHDTLEQLVPTQQSELDSDLASTLASLPDGSAKTAGISAGRSQAAGVLAQRANDGLSTAALDTPFATPAPALGTWQPTPPSYHTATRAGQGSAESFLLRSDDQFDAGPPPGLTSPTYLNDVAEVEAYGSATGSLRTQAQTDVALFWEPAANIQYIQIVRALIAQEQRSIAWDTRFVAAFQIVTTDAQISIYNAKYRYVRWRPVTAIRTGSPGVTADPSWTPLFNTPSYPEYPSGHGGYAGAAQQVLDAFVGASSPQPITVTSPNDPGAPQTYSDWSTVTRQVIDARVWEGIHFRFADLTGDRQGAAVADWDLARLGALGI